jgi:hypothetical protein
MATHRPGGFLIVLALFLAIAASITFPVSYYMARDEAAREAILASNRSGWVMASWLWIASGVTAAAGVLLVALSLPGKLALAGAGVFAIGCLFWVIYAYLRSLDPEFSDTGLWMEATFGWLTMAGFAMLGIVFLRSGLFRWAAIIHLGYALLFLIAFLLLRNQMYDFFPPQSVFLVGLPMGILALKSNLGP